MTISDITTETGISDPNLSAFALTGDITASGLTMPTGKLLGRGAAGTGAIEAITPGAGLTLTGTTLSASGGGLTVGTTTIANNTSGRMLYDNAGVLGETGGLTTDGSVLTNTQSVATTSTDGYILTTSAAAVAGAQKYSPRIRWTGNGWKTDATAGSQAVSFIAEVRPVQGAAAPTGYWALSSAINGGAYTDRLTVDSSGNAVISGSLIVPAGSAAAPSVYFTGGNTGFYQGFSGWVTFGSSGTAAAAIGPAGRVQLVSTGLLEFSSGAVFAATDLAYSRNAAGVAEFNNGTPGTFRDLKLRTLFPGGGATVTTNTPVIDATQTWNDASVYFVGMIANFTATACQDYSSLLGLQIAGANKFAVFKNGQVQTSGLNFNGSGITAIVNNANLDFHVSNLGDTIWRINGVTGSWTPLAAYGVGTSTRPIGDVYSTGDARFVGYKWGSYKTVGTLPSAAASEGLAYLVNDSLTPVVGVAVSAGGSAKCAVMSNGTSWIVTWLL